MAFWMPIPSEPGYAVSDDGQVKSLDRIVHTANGQVRTYRGRLLSPGKMSGGHVSVACGKGNTRTVHSLVAEAFLGPPPPSCEVLHYDGVHDNNQLGNLRYGTRSENLRDNTRLGKSTLTLEQVESIRSRYKPYCKKNGGRKIATEMGVSLFIIHSCLSGKNYGS